MAFKVSFTAQDLSVSSFFFFLTWKISKLLIMTGHRVKVFFIFSCEQNYLLNVWLGLERWLSQKRRD